MQAGKELTRGTVTSASRVMVPAYIAHAAYFAIIYTFDPQDRLAEAPGVALIRLIGLPFSAWGGIMTTLVVIYLIGLLKRSRQVFVFGLYCHAVVMLWWAVIYLGSTMVNPAAPFGAFAWPVLVAIACHASARSLLAGEVR